jgi:hypothetical protein
MMSQHGASGLRHRRRLPRLAIVRRLAAGVPPERVGEGTGLEPHEIEAILAERGLERAVAAYRELLATPPEARLARLYELALQVLEQALAEGCRLTLVYMLRGAGAGRDPVAWLAARIHQRLEAAPPPVAPSESAPEPAPPEGAAARRPVRRPDPLDAQAWRTAARLRREILGEAGLAAADLPPPAPPAGPEPRDGLDLTDPVADPLGAAVHRLHRAADRRHAEQRRMAMAPPEPRGRQRPRPRPSRPPSAPASPSPSTGCRPTPGRRCSPSRPSSAASCSVSRPAARSSTPAPARRPSRPPGRATGPWAAEGRKPSPRPTRSDTGAGHIRPPATPGQPADPWAASGALAAARRGLGVDRAGCAAGSSPQPWWAGEETA